MLHPEREMGNRIRSFCLSTLALLLLFGLSSAKEAQLEFKVVPNKAGKIEIALDTPPIESSTCFFEWDSTGATVEVRKDLFFFFVMITRVMWAALLTR